MLQLNKFILIMKKEEINTQKLKVKIFILEFNMLLILVLIMEFIQQVLSFNNLELIIEPYITEIQKENIEELKDLFYFQL